MPASSTRNRYLVVMAALLVLIAIAAILMATFDWNRARGWIAEKVRDRTGRELVIAGDLRVHPFSWHPRVHAEQVSLANADWGEGQPLLTADTVDFSVSLMSLLRGDVVFPEVALDKASILLQRDAEGRRNWILKPSEQKEGKSPEIRNLAINDGQLKVKDHPTDTDVTVTVQSTPGETYGIAVGAQGRIRGFPVKLKGVGGGLLTLLDTATPYPLKLGGTVGGAQAAFDGTITGLADLGAIDARLTVAGRDLALLADAINIALPHTAPYKLDGNLQRRGPQWGFSGFRGTVGDSDLSGDFDVDVSGERPVLRAKLTSKLLDIADLGGFVGTRPGNAPATKAPGKVLPSEPYNLEKLRRVDAHVALTAARFRNRDKYPLDNLKATLDLVDGVFKLEPIVFGVAGGTMSSVVTVDARAPRLAVDMSTSFSKVHINQLIPGAKILDDSFGAIGGKARLKGQGNSIAAMLGTSGGRVDLYSRGGAVSNLLMEFAGADIAEIIGFWIGGDQQIQLRCGIMAFAVKDGVMTSDALIVDTDDTYIGGKGTVSLRDETLNMTLTPLPKDFSILTLRGPLRVRGTFSDPSFGLEKSRLAIRAGAAVLLGLLNPLAAIIPLIETGPGKNAACNDLLASVEATAKGRKAKPAAAER